MERFTNLGAVLAIIVLVLTVVFVAVGQMDFRLAGLIGALALSRLV